MFIKYSIVFVEEFGRQRSKWTADNSGLGADQLAWRALNRNGIEYSYQDGGLQKPNVSPWVAQAPVIDNLAWQKVKRNVDYFFDEAGRTARWIPAASNLGQDQLAWKGGLQRSIQYEFQDGGLRSKWLPDNSRLGDNQFAWRQIQRDPRLLFFMEQIDLLDRRTAYAETFGKRPQGQFAGKAHLLIERHAWIIPPIRPGNQDTPSIRRWNVVEGLRSVEIVTTVNFKWAILCCKRITIKLTHVILPATSPEYPL